MEKLLGMNIFDEFIINLDEEEIFDEEGYPKNPFYSTILRFENIIGMITYRVFIRGRCAIFGCDYKSSGSPYLPDDCIEWGCNRCGAEGINSQVFTRDAFHGDNKIRDFISALRGE